KEPTYDVTGRRLSRNWACKHNPYIVWSTRDKYWLGSAYETSLTTISVEQLKELLNVKEEMNNNGKQTLTREQFKEIVDIACISWKSNLIDVAKGQDALSSNIVLSDNYVEKMYKASSPEQTDVLDKYLKRADKDEFLLNFTKETKQGFDNLMREMDVTSL